MKQLVTGASGFIGSNMINNGLLAESAIFLSREDFNLGKQEFQKKMSQLVSSKSLVQVINMMAMPGSGKTKEEKRNIQEANFSNALLLLESLIDSHSIIQFINFSSYFQFYFYKYGKDKDEYAYWRRLFSDKLKQSFDSKVLYSYLDIYLPHIYGSKERSTRLFPSLIGAIRSGELLEVSNGQQFIPLLSIDDMLGNLKLILEAKSIWNQAIYLKPEIQITLSDLLSSLKRDVPLQIRQNRILDRENEFTSVIVPPENVYIWESRIDNNWKKYLLNGGNAQ